jgi:hypothetical protein
MPSRITSTDSVAAVVPCVGGVVLTAEPSARSGIGYTRHETQRTSLKEVLFSVALIVGTTASLVALSSVAKNFVPATQTFRSSEFAEVGTDRVSYHIATYDGAYIAE